MLTLCHWRSAPVVARAGSALSRGNSLSLQVLILMAKVSPSVLGIRTADGRTPADLAQSKVCKQVRLQCEDSSAKRHVEKEDAEKEASTV